LIVEATFGQSIASEVMSRQDKHAFQEAEPEFRASFIRTVSPATHHRPAFWKAFSFYRGSENVRTESF